MTNPANTFLELGMLPAWLEQHIQAIEDTCRAGYRFLYLPNLENLTMLQAFHSAHGATDWYCAGSATEAIGSRFVLDFGRPRQLWQACGSVTDVIGELLQLPPHGSPGAPSLALSGPSDLWVPPLARSTFGGIGLS
ncbi:hypothetical protein SAMN05216215_103310 [Saccharopolyspora shandongensis]|uniref:Uncharacterized protein n=1 Tax=Saccharopolyspora shandongensis TaxID=418495 RepID=A0A1H3M286_9PSEU|nr:hypothetical protein [Saccharopolyspora shandongensis]SDY70368.1 hypothetical protein SAMN05216215_103310 [Saccharopolyspora shandongensis]